MANVASARSKGLNVRTLLLYWLSGFVPRRKTQLVFGAWLGSRYADNPKYLFEYLAETEPSLQLIWSGHEAVRSELPDAPNVTFVRHGSWSANWAILRAGACFVSHDFFDLGHLNLSRRSVSVYLGHGLAIKNMGPGPEGDAAPWLLRLQRVWRSPMRIAHWVASSDLHATKLVEEYEHYLIDVSMILRSGQPRLDPLFASRTDTAGRLAIRRHLLDRYGLPEDARLISYLPTFRGAGQTTFSFAELGDTELVMLTAVLDRHGARVGVKNHAADTTAQGAEADQAPWLLELGGDTSFDTQELLVASDVLVTDYSGCYIDFLIVDRPIIHFAYDHESYCNADRGLYFSLNEIAGGDVVTEFDEFVEQLDVALTEPSHGAARRAELRHKLLAWEDGNARSRTARVVKELLGLR